MADLCDGFPDQFVNFINRCKGYEFEDKPEYDLLYTYLDQIIEQENFKEDYEWDWTIQMER